MSEPRRQFVRYLFLRLDPEWRRLPHSEQIVHKQELGAAIRRFHGRLLLRSFSLAGTRGDADVMLWHVADDLDTLQGLQTAVFSTGLGGYFSIAHSYLGMTRRSIYQFPDLPEQQIEVRPQDSPYLFVYPFVKTREWYALPMERRQEMMEQHVTIGRKYPAIRLNTIYSFGLDDQDFVVAFEGDDPAGFLDLVMELRESAASRYTLRDTPTFTCIQMSIGDALDSLGGGTLADRPTQAIPADQFTPVARMGDLSPGRGRRVYLGRDAIALFHVGGRVYAVSDRCTHGRGSLSEGAIDPGSCILQCPWHGGKFHLATGEPAAPPARVAVRTYEVRVEGDRILVR
jgi:chlorite dismutase/nitrite reductase/ring-hydroxylating ferredoxin subunit